MKSGFGEYSEALAVGLSRLWGLAKGWQGLAKSYQVGRHLQVFERQRVATVFMENSGVGQTKVRAAIQIWTASTCLNKWVGQRARQA